MADTKISALTETKNIEDSYLAAALSGSSYKLSLGQLVRNYLLNLANMSKAIASSIRVLNTFADGYKASDGVNSGSSSNYSVNTTSGYVGPTPATSTTSDGANSGTVAYGSVTLVDRNISLTNGDTITAIGVSLNNAQTITVKILKRNSAGNYDVVVSQSFSHPGGGFADATLSSSYTVPGTGTYYIGLWLSSTDATRSSSIARSFKSSVDVTGTGQTGFTEDTSVNIPAIRYTKQSGVNNVTLVTTSQTADATVDHARCLLEIDPIDSITLGTDLTIELTCNGATNWTTAGSYTNCGKGQLGRTVIETDDVACTAGTSFAARIKTLNNKNVNVYKTTVTVH